MNNTLCLGVFLLIIYLQDLSWKYTAEVSSCCIEGVLTQLWLGSI